MYLKMIKRRLLSIVGAMVFLFAISACSSGENAVFSQISAEEAKNMMESLESYTLLDVRTEEEYAEKHIPGAVLIPDTEIAQRAEEELHDKEEPIFVYCRSGRRSKLAARELADLGYKNVYEFGGIIDWPYETE